MTQHSKIMPVSTTHEMAVKNNSVDQSNNQNHHTEKAPQQSRSDYLKHAAKEYMRFLVDPTFIVGHMVKIVICIGLLYYMHPANVLSDLAEIKIALQGLLLLGIGMQIVISASQSMLIPIVAVATSVVADAMLKSKGAALPFDPILLQYLFAAGVCGIGVGVFFRPSL